MFELNPHKKRGPLEIGKSGIEAAFVRAVKAVGGKAYKFTSEMNRGVSDRIVVTPGQVWFVEIKRAKGVLTPLQQDFRTFIKYLGLNHFVVYGNSGIKDFLNLIK